MYYTIYMNNNLITYFIDEDQNYNFFSTTAPLLNDFKNMEVNKLCVHGIDFIFIKINCAQNKIGDILYLIRNIFKFQIHIFTQPFTNKRIEQYDKAHELHVKKFSKSKMI